MLAYVSFLCMHTIVRSPLTVRIVYHMIADMPLSAIGDVSWISFRSRQCDIDVQDVVGLEDCKDNHLLFFLI